MRCKHCKTKFEQKKRFNVKYCFESEECIKAWRTETIEKKRIADIKAWSKEKKVRKEKLMTVQDWVKKTQITFNAYIRKRDKGQVCISCQKPAKKENACHFYNSNNHWNIRFHEDNVHLGCEYCNTYLSGNLIEYRKHLIAKIGIERVEHLDSIARLTRKFTIDELKQINEEYKRKTKELI